MSWKRLPKRATNILAATALIALCSLAFTFYAGAALAEPPISCLIEHATAQAESPTGVLLAHHAQNETHSDRPSHGCHIDPAG